jgi:hypothetical protein
MRPARHSESAHIGYIRPAAITSAWGGGPDLAAIVGPRALFA